MVHPLPYPAIGETDCETLGSGLLAQPVNALTSIAYCVVGVVVIVLALRRDRWRARTIIFGSCLIGAGIGSVLFHGPQPAGSRFFHDVPIVLIVLLMALHNLTGHLLKTLRQQLLKLETLSNLI